MAFCRLPLHIECELQEPFCNEMESHFFGPLHTFLHAGVGVNHLIIPVNPPHVLVVVIYKLVLMTFALWIVERK